ncbi:MAG: protein kinase [Deltaproteobacteria bacterium]|nr:protein kinase [Deltaproteobacteria bacterium]
MSDPAPASGETFGRYQLLERIGQGGMAEVFKAKRFGVEGFEKVLVIKRIVPELAAHPEFVEMFVQEAKLAVRLSHANIVQTFDLGRIEATADGQPSYFIAMEYVPGLDLASLLARFQRKDEQLPLGMAVYVTAEVAKALDHAHRRQDEDARSLDIVHRDISPQNILLSWDGDVKVTDFGIAKAADTITVSETSSELEAARATGKLAFMSPEQARSERTDGRSDLFSLGTTLYQMIAGSNPFAAPTATETLRRIEAGEYPPIDLVRPEAPAALAEIVADLLEEDRERRLGSAAKLIERLLAYNYTSGEHFGAADLAALLAPSRSPAEPDGVEPASMFDVPSEAVDKTPVEIPRGSTPPPPPGDAALTGERREVTLLVLSFGGSEGGQAREPLLARIRDILDRHGAWIEALKARQVVAIFGLGDTDGRDAEAAVRAGLVLVRERRFDTIISAGIHSGPISVDDGGIPYRDERHVAMLARAQTLARATEGQVALSQVSARLVRRSFVTESLPESIRAVSDGGLVVRRALARDTTRGRFVGRRKALKRLGSILALATRNEPQIVVVRGETGMGKSRLLTEAKRRLERGQFKVAFYGATCPPNGATVPWSGLKSMLHVLCGTQEDDDPKRILEVRPRLRALGLRDEHAGSVLTLLGAPTGTKDSESRSVLRASFARMVSSLARDRLHCLAWDDAQAIDRETLDALLRTTRKGSKMRCVFLLALRSDIPPALSKRKNTHVLTLAELSKGEAAKLIETQLGARSLPGELLDYVHDCAGGHPLFIDELLRELCDTGVVQVLNGAVTLKAESHATAPRTLRTLIADRISHLQQRETKVLQGLAVLGEPAFTGVLSSVLDHTLPVLDRHLSSLETKGLVRRIGPTQVRFASPLFEEIVLASMPPSARKDLHARAATTYDQVELPGAGEKDERIAQHLSAAGTRDRAVTHFWKSAEDKLAVGQLEGALRVMLQGLEVADVSRRDVDELVGWLEKLATCVSQVRQATGLKEALNDVLREVTSRGEERDRVMAHIHVASALGSVNLFDDAFQALAYADPDELDDDDLKRASLTAETQLASRQGLFVRAVKAGDRLEAMGPGHDTQASLMLALARTMDGQGEAALELLDRLDEQSKPKDLVEQVIRQKHRALTMFYLRDWERAAREASELAQVARAAGLRFDTAAALHNLGDSCDRLGDHPRSYAAFVESLELTQALDHDRLSNLNQMHLCLLDGLRTAEGAEDRLKTHLRYADAHGYHWDVLEGRFMLARLSAARGDHQRAQEQLTEVIEVAREGGHKITEADAEELLAKVAR